ncbi:hypothetical protein EC968_000879 [Mortierella alpina]|nr:hypothetical protein EC968_000879 [Mortierella alpina]
MGENQSFRLIGTTDIVTIPIQHANGQDLVCWEDIDQVFPGVKSVKNGDVPVPHYIKPVPNEVLTVVLSDTTNCLPADSTAPNMVPIVTANLRQTLGATDARSDPSGKGNLVEGLRVTSVPAERLIDNIGTHSSASELSLLPPGSPFGSETTLKTALSFIEALKRASKNAKEVGVQALPQEGNGAMAHVIKLLEAADTRQEEMQQQTLRLHKELKQSQEMAAAKQEEMIRLQNLALEKQQQMEQQARDHHEEIKQLQIQALGQLAVLQSRVQAVLTQTFELHEYPIPRLFIVLPQYPSGWDILKPFTEKYRLYFLCECGEHTKAAGGSSNIPHKFHLAKHEGYEIARPTEFFQQYGPYILTILKMLKFGISVASVAVPAVAHLLNADALEHAGKGLQHLKDCIEPGMDQVICKIEKDSVDEREPVETFGDHMENKEALEGADLRKLETFLKDKDGNKVLGNLYRTVTDEGHVKWVCIDHYRENYNQTAVAAFRRVVESLGGSFDENHGVVKVKLRSRASANELYLALRKSRSVHELDVDFDWACSGTDLRALEDALRSSAIAILHVLYRLTSLPNMKSIHIVLPEDYIKLSDVTPKRPSHLRKLTFAVEVEPNVRIHADILETGLTVRRLRFWDASIESDGTKALAEALNTMTCLDIERNSISAYKAQALWEAFKKNSSVDTLHMSGNSIGDNGAQALSKALKTNSTLTSLDLESNSIGDNGAQALSEALKINLALTHLRLKSNPIGDNGTQALSEALKTNSTLTYLDLESSSIRDGGAQALSEALKTNSTLTSLDLDSNSIGDNGAQALSKALKINLALTHLRLKSNSIGDNGSQALSEALKTNSTLTRLDLDSNSIGDDGAQALSEALKTISTLANLYLSSNSIGDNGAQALSEALKTNSTLANLDLYNNSIKNEGAQALSEALKTNSSLTYLSLSSNPIGDNGAQALFEALKINSTLATLRLSTNSISAKGAQELKRARKTNPTLTIEGL